MCDVQWIEIKSCQSKRQNMRQRSNRVGHFRLVKRSTRWKTIELSSVCSIFTTFNERCSVIGGATQGMHKPVKRVSVLLVTNEPFGVCMWFMLALSSIRPLALVSFVSGYKHAAPNLHPPCPLFSPTTTTLISHRCHSSIQTYYTHHYLIIQSHTYFPLATCECTVATQLHLVH